MVVAEIVQSIRTRLSNNDTEKYKLDEGWEKILSELRREVSDNGFDLKENERLMISLVAKIAEENEEGLRTMASEEVAEKSRMGEDTSIDEDSGVTIKTIHAESEE